MNPTIQPGTHPDAESLSAFAEQWLSGAEREQILAHMAVCGRCREVVFLAQQAMEAEQPARASIEKGSTQKVTRRWFAGWRLAWVPVAALAGFVGFAVEQHMRHGAPEQQMARNLTQTPAIQGALSAKAENALVMQQAPRREESTTLSAVRQSVGKSKQEDAKVPDEKKTARQKDDSEQSADSRREVAGVSGGVVNGIAVARAKSSSAGGPMAQNQMQQQNQAGGEQNALVQAQVAGNETSNKPIAPAAPASTLHPDTVSESVEVQPTHQAALASPAAAPQIATVPVNGQNFDLARDKVAKLKGAPVMLPSGFEALSVAPSAGRVIAIDSAGALFLSEDAGKHWQPVRAQWTGRAVQVRTLQADAQFHGLLKQQRPRFELVTDKLQTWVSVDGKSWTEQASSGK